MVKIKMPPFCFNCREREREKCECDVTRSLLTCIIQIIVCSVCWPMIFTEKLFSWLPPIMLFVCFILLCSEKINHKEKRQR